MQPLYGNKVFPILTLLSLFLQIAEMVYAITGNLQLVLPEENSLLIGQKDFTDIATNRYFHPLLPGVVVRIPTFQKQLVLQLCKNMRGSAHFKHCLLAIQHMQAPNWSGDIPFASVEITPADDLGPKLSSTTDNNTGTVRRFKMVLPRRAVTYLIGKNGHKIEQLRTQTRATIKIRDPQPSSSSSSAASHQRNFTGSSFLQEIVITADDEDELNYARSLIEEQIKLWLC